MKKILLLLLTLISVQGFAQLARTAQFDFAHPNSLTPSISNATYHGAWTMVTEKTFTDGLASISFDYNNAEIDTWNPTGNNPSYYLSLSRGTYMVISVTGGCTINKVTINKNSSDAVYLLADRGSYNSSNGIWTPGSNSYHQVGLYYSSSQAPIIEHVQVEYSEPNEVLSASVSPGPEERPSTFSQLSLYYSNAQGAMSVQSQSGITISGAYDDPAHGEVHPTLSASASGNSVYLTCTPILVHDGTFTINIPAGAFRDAAGYENTALTTTVTVRENRATFDTTAVVVQKAAEEYTLLNHCDIYTFPEEIILEFPTNIGHLDTETKFRLFREGTSDPVAQMKLAPVEGENKKAKLVFHSKSEDTFAKGVYHITVDQKVIYNSNYEDALYERYNPEFALTFNYKEAPDPLKGKKDEVAALKTEAAELYAKINTLGYPKADDATNPLLAVKDQEVATTEDDLNTQISNLKAAIKAFYDATDVVLPVAATSEETGWYTITSVAEGSELPLHYSNGAVTVGGTATAFQIQSITDEGVIVLKTKDSKYLHVLTPATASTTTSAKNVTDSYMEAVNKLTIQKLKLAGDDTDQKPVAGLFTIKGSLGRDGSDNLLGTPTALVAHPAGTILTSTSDNTLYFATDKSSGFRFVSTTKPDDEPVTPPVTEVSPKATLGADAIDDNTIALALIINGKSNADDITTVALNSNPSNDQKPYFVVKNADNSEGSVVTSFTGTAILEAFPESGYGNYFKVHVNGLEDGNYYLILPVGTFDYSGNANTVIDERMRVDFKIQSDSGSGSGSGGGSGDTSGFKTDLAQVQPYSTSPYFDGDVAVNPTVLNDFRVYSYKREGETEQTFFADTEKKVILAGYFNSQEYHQGHLEFDPTYNSAQVWCYKIVWEPAITEEDFHSSEPYNLGIKILDATLGDKNFKAWLDNPSSISKENCHVNREFVTFVKVDYNVPTEADKAGLSQTIAEAEAYHLSIEASHPSVAKTLEDAIDTAKNKLANAASTKRILALAKQDLEAAIEAAKQAIATSVSPRAYLSGSELDSNTKMLTLIINGKSNADDITTVALNSNPSNDQKPYFVVKNADNSKGSVVTSFTGTAILEAFPESGYNNYFKVHVNGLAPGDYYLILPVGTFDYSGNTNPVTDEHMEVAFKINSDNNAVFADYKADKKTVATNRAQEGDSEECAALITAAKAAIDALSYDTTKSLDANKELVDAIIAKLDADLAAQRDIDASKAALSKAIADATAYVESIKGEHKAFADVLDMAINAAKAKLSDVTATKSNLDDAKQTLESAVATIKQAIATGIEEMEVSGGVEGAAYYTLDGRKLDGKPTKKGVYIVNGRKVVIK